VPSDRASDSTDEAGWGFARYRRKSRTALRLLTGSAPADIGQGPRVARWERKAEWPLALAALIFLAAYAAQVLARPTGVARAVVAAAIWITWLAFAADYGFRVAMARRRLVYASRHWLDLLIIALPVLRPLRVLRVIMLVRMLNRKAASSLRGRVVVYGAFTAALLLFCAALAVLQAERGNPDANIKSFGDALWWSIVTMCTVGYGDRYPVTGEGRLVGVGLMITGVGLFGAVTASFATWLVDQLRTEEDAARAATQRDLEALKVQLDRIERSIAAARDREPGRPTAERQPAAARRSPGPRRHST
jgi:voltage-gated potassium channel